MVLTENENSKSSVLINTCLPSNCPTSRPTDVLFLRRMHLQSDKTQIPWDDVICLLWWSLLTMLPECLFVTVLFTCAAYHLNPKRSWSLSD
ncbi:uncharacterized protein LOC141902499 isoform X2 [Tubulanus polymorphus]